MRIFLNFRPCFAEIPMANPAYEQIEPAHFLYIDCHGAGRYHRVFGAS